MRPPFRILDVGACFIGAHVKHLCTNELSSVNRWSGFLILRSYFDAGCCISRNLFRASPFHVRPMIGGTGQPSGGTFE
jgi:hypothetical protein